MGRYIVREAEEYYDMNECDARGYPVKRIRYTGVEYETTSEPDDSISCSVAGDGYTEVHTVIAGGSARTEQKESRRVGYMDLKSPGAQYEEVMELGDGYKVVRTIAQYSIGVTGLRKNTFKGCSNLKTVHISRRLYKKTRWLFPKKTEFLFYENKD